MSMSDIHIEMQDEILLMAEELGGEFTVEDAEQHLAKNFPTFFSGPNSYTLTQEFLAEMVEAGLLAGGYEDFFQLPG